MVATVYTMNDKDRDISGLIRENDPAYSRSTETMILGSGVVKANTVLGKITASGKWKPYTPGAVDGSQNAAGILLYETDTTVDVLAPIGVRDQVWAVNFINWGAAVTTQPHKDTAIAALKALPGPIVIR
jgi:Bacteriophage lambda head decoration protein D